MAGPEKARERQRILVVEDDPLLRRAVHAALEKSGFEVASAETGAEALEELSRFRPRLLVVDYYLPDMNGSEVVREARKIDPDLPFVAMTGQEDVEIAVSLMREGASDFLIKTDRIFEILPQAVSQALDKVALRERLARAETLARQSEETARVLLNAPDHEAWLTDVHGSVLDVNAAAALSTDRSREDLLGKKIFEIFPPEVVEQRMAKASLSIQSVSSQAGDEWRGNQIFHERVVPIMGATGSVERLAFFSETSQSENKLNSDSGATIPSFDP